MHARRNLKGVLWFLLSTFVLTWGLWSVLWVPALRATPGVMTAALALGMWVPGLCALAGDSAGARPKRANDDDRSPGNETLLPLGLVLADRRDPADRGPDGRVGHRPIRPAFQRAPQGDRGVGRVAADPLVGRRAGPVSGGRDDRSADQRPVRRGRRNRVAGLPVAETDAGRAGTMAGAGAQRS